MKWSLTAYKGTICIILLNYNTCTSIWVLVLEAVSFYHHYPDMIQLMECLWNV